MKNILFAVVALSLSRAAASADAWDSAPRPVQEWDGVWFTDENGVDRGLAGDADLYLIRHADARAGSARVYAVDLATARKRLRDGDDRYVAFDKVAVTPYRVARWTKPDGGDDSRYWGGPAVEIVLDGNQAFRAVGVVTTMWWFLGGRDAWFDVDDRDGAPWSRLTQAIESGNLKVQLAQPSESRHPRWIPLTARLAPNACEKIDFQVAPVTPGSLRLDAGFVPFELELMQFEKVAPESFYLGVADPHSAGRDQAMSDYQKTTGAAAYATANAYLYGQRGYMASLAGTFAATRRQQLAGAKGDALHIPADESKILACRLRDAGLAVAFDAELDKLAVIDDDAPRKRFVAFWRAFLIDRFAIYASYADPEGRGRKYFSMPRSEEVNKKLDALRVANTKACFDAFVAGKDRCDDRSDDAAPLYPIAPPRTIEDDEPVVVRKPVAPPKAPSKRIKSPQELEDEFDKALGGGR